MVKPRTLGRSRRLTAAWVIFGLFILADIALFGWLLIHTLSKRWVERALLEFRDEAVPLARMLEEKAEELELDELSLVVITSEETKTYIKSVLAQRDIVQRVEIRDRDGALIWAEEKADRLPVDPERPSTAVIDPKGLEGKPEVTSGQLVEVEIGDLGTLSIGISEEEVQRRGDALRRELLRQAGLIGALTVFLLLVAFVTITRLVLRTRRLEAQALEAERMAYIGTLASGLAHEIRSPLNSLGLNLQMLEEDLGSGQGAAGQGRLLQLTRSELKRLERLTTDFLTYARPRRPEVRRVEAAGLARRVIEVLGPELVKQGIPLELEDRSQGAAVEVDSAQLEQLLLNLVQNALAAARKSAAEGQVRIRLLTSQNDVTLEVIDNGPGIPEPDRQRIFDLFYSTRKGGTGLGLAIVQRIAEAHGARLAVRYNPGGGTVFQVRLPRAAASPSPDGVLAPAT